MLEPRLSRYRDTASNHDGHYSDHPSNDLNTGRNPEHDSYYVDYSYRYYHSDRDYIHNGNDRSN